MGVGTCTSKSLLVILGTIFTCTAFALWGLAGYVLVSYHQFDDFAEQKLTLWPAIAAIAVGAILFLAGVLGCCGKDNKCTLSLFAGFLLLLLTLLVAGVVLSQVFKGKIQQSVNKEGTATLAKYGRNDSTTLSDNVDFVQRTLMCCGLHNYTDWASEPWGEEHVGFVPGSCCDTSSGNCTDEKEPVPVADLHRIYQEGCVDKLVHFFDGKVQWVLGSLLGFAVLLILGIVASCVLCCLRKQEQVPYFSLH